MIRRSCINNCKLRTNFMYTSEYHAYYTLIVEFTKGMKFCVNSLEKIA
jgi:hypothetical protein